MSGVQPTDRQDELSRLRGDCAAASEKAALASRDVDWMKALIFIMSGAQCLMFLIVAIMFYFIHTGIIENRQAIVENRKAIVAWAGALTEHDERYRHTEK